jgi:ribosome recycling factor
MGKLVLLVAAVIGGLAFWRRKTLKDDATKVTEAAKSQVSKIKGEAPDDVVDIRQQAEAVEEILDEETSTGSPSS